MIKENLTENIYRKWVVEVIESPRVNVRKYHLHMGNGVFYDTRLEARRAAKALKANYCWSTRVRRYNSVSE